jgi:hypothetical protein
VPFLSLIACHPHHPPILCLDRCRWMGPGRYNNVAMWGLLKGFKQKVSYCIAHHALSTHPHACTAHVCRYTRAHTHTQVTITCENDKGEEETMEGQYLTCFVNHTQVQLTTHATRRKIIPVHAHYPHALPTRITHTHYPHALPTQACRNAHASGARYTCHPQHSTFTQDVAPHLQTRHTDARVDDGLMDLCFVQAGTSTRGEV